MPSPVIEGFLYSWKKNQDYAPKLVADLSEDQMVAQPASNRDAPANHPAWVFSHLNIYLPVICAIINNEEFEDPKSHPFGMLSKPEPLRETYASKQELLDVFTKGHDRVAKMLGDADDSVLTQEIQLSRWSTIMPTAAVALPYLMFNHENMHLGQLSAWRRIQGLPSV